MIRRRVALACWALVAGAALTAVGLSGATASGATTAGARASGATASGATAASHGQSGTQVIPPDYQGYVVDTPVDPYNSDPSSIHVAVNGGNELARSFVHFALNYLPPGASATGLTATFHVTEQSGASNTGVYQLYNVNTSSAIVEACALVKAPPASLSASNAPAYDCAGGSSVGVPSDSDNLWTFNLRDLLRYWSKHGNTGFALVPVVTSGSTWGVAFYVSVTSSTASYVIPAATSASHHKAVVVPPPAAKPTATSITPTGPTAQPAPVAAPPTAAAPAVTTPPALAATAPPTAAPTLAPATVAPTPTNSGSGGSKPIWPWVLVGSLAVAAGSLGWAHRAGVVAFARRVGPPSIAAFRAHPRAYTVASVAVVWGLIYSGYSLDQASPRSQLDVAAGQPGSGAAQQQTTGTTPGTVAVTGKTKQGAVAHTTGTLSTAAVPYAATATTATVGKTAQTQQQQAVATEFSGGGTYRTIDGTQVFFPSNGGAPVAKYYSGSDDTIGITPSALTLCAHAALTYGPAFNISASDLNVYWDYVNAHGGLDGRKVSLTYENDNYDPGTAVQAAQTCKDLGTFMLLGGIGFDQIPAVRVWAEQNHELYLHHVATIEGSQGLRYSFTEMPSVEEFGTWFGQLAAAKYPGKKVGILYRESPNWEPALNTFEQTVKAAGMQVVGAYPVQINQGNYTQEIAELHASGAQVVFGLENALAVTEMIEQAENQNYFPAWLVFPFNLETKTLGAGAFKQPILGVASWDPYDAKWSGGSYASYSSDIAEFNAEYKQYDPNANLNGDGGDLLFLNWEADRQVADLFLACGPDCTRNRMAGVLLAGYDKTVSPACNVDFNTGDHHHAGYLADFVENEADPSGQAAWVPLQRCVTQY